MTIKSAISNLITNLAPIYDEREASNIATFIFEDVFNIKNAMVSDNAFDSKHQKKLSKIEERLLKYEPWQYIVGEADFYELKFKVTPAVLIPRPETEELVYWIHKTVKRQSAVSILDIGTGSGCIPITLKHKLPNAEISAVDISEEALKTAKFNAKKNNVDVGFRKLDILSKKARKKLPDFDVIVSNPPYIPNQEKKLMRENVLKYEPHLALFVENENPTVFYHEIALFAKKHLNENGYLFFEINEFYGRAIIEMLIKEGFKNIQMEKDLTGKDRMIRCNYN
jgi:release factor glutamine methyltransferase